MKDLLDTIGILHREAEVPLLHLKSALPTTLNWTG
jgi:hypothetical protein